jgi:hypothetical protein
VPERGSSETPVGLSVWADQTGYPAIRRSKAGVKTTMVQTDKAFLIAKPMRKALSVFHVFQVAQQVRTDHYI